jgi:hypothetical protein
MADTKFSGFTGATTVNPSSDVVVGVQNGANTKYQLSTLFTNLSSTVLVAGYNKVTSKNITSTGSSVAVDKAIVHLKNTTGLSRPMTLPNGVEGQELTLLGSSLTSSVVVTPTNPIGFTSITFATNGSSAIIQYIDGAWWLLSTRLTTVA